MTNAAPMPPISTRNSKNVWKLWTRPIPITGNEPRTRSQVNALRGPIRSQTWPITIREITVIATEPMMHQPTWSLLRCISARTTDIRGAMPNHAKKHRKNANQDMWNARICGVEKLNRSIRVALPDWDMGRSAFLERRSSNGSSSVRGHPRPAGRMRTAHDL